MSENKFPWFNEYKLFGIPKSFKPYPEEPVCDILELTAKKYKNAGLIQMNYKMPYPLVKDHVDRLATALYNMGLRKGDSVATILPTSIQFVIADYAISRAGCVHIPASSLEPAKTLEHKFEEGKPKAVICLNDYLTTVLPVVEKQGIPHCIVTQINDYSLVSHDRGEREHIHGTIWLTDLIADTPPAPPDIEFNVEHDLETLLFTGGTTGLPKGCMLTHRNIYANAIQNSHVMGQSVNLLRGAVAVILGLPFYHSYGHTIMHTMTYNGFNQILVPDPRDTKGMVRMIKKYYPILQFGVPTQFMNLSNEDLKGIGIIGISGSAPLSPNTQKEFEQKSSGGIMEGYGLSEMSPTTHLNTSFLIRVLGGRTPVRLTSSLLAFPGVSYTLNGMLRLAGSRNVGRMVTSVMSRLVERSSAKSSAKPAKTEREKRGTTGIPYPDTEVKLLDIDSGERLTWNDIRNGRTGEMCLKGPQRMLGYWPRPGSGLDEEGFVRTSDVVKVDKNGYFYIVDRTKDMIIVSGYKVYSRELDDILINHPSITVGATVGIPDKEREGSEVVVVFVQLKDGKKHRISEDDIRLYLKPKVARYAVPKIVRFIDSMPLTAMEKVDKKHLRKMAMEDGG
ncbi:MAG: long-chain fatty acid--CoA ligase [bacterium]|nr:long-chain fatty acid--CoA ligase [bacterium]